MWHVGNFTNTQFFTFSTIHVKIPFYWQLPYKLPPGPLQGHWQQIIFDLILYQRFSTILAGDNVRFVTIFSHAYQSFFLHICTKLCLPILSQVSQLLSHGNCEVTDWHGLCIKNWTPVDCIDSPYDALCAFQFRNKYILFADVSDSSFELLYPN